MGIRIRVVLGVQLALLLASTGASASTFGCLPRTGFTYDPEILYLLNGYPVTGAAATLVQQGSSGSGQFPAAFSAVSVEDVISLTIICDLQVDEKRMRHAVSMVTRSGVEGMLRSFLTDLARMQEESFRTTGKYISNLASIGFFHGRMMIPLTVEATSAGWAATARFGNASKECHIVVGNARGPRPELTPGQVGCFAT